MSKRFWPEQYVNRKCQEHEEKLLKLDHVINDLLSRLDKLESKPKRGRPASKE